MGKHFIPVSFVLVLSLAICGCATTNESGSDASEIKSVASEPVVAEGLAGFTVDGETDLSGNFYLSFVYSRNLVMLDGKGNIIWSKHEEQPTENALTGLWDFKKHVVGGKTYYSYHDNTGTYDNYGLEGYGPGERVILDENFNEIKRITFEKSSVTEKGDPLDGHDFLMIDLGHYILSGYIKGVAMNHPDYPDGTSVVYSYLQEVEDGNVVWEFSSIDYPELYAMTITDASEKANDFANERTDAPDIIHFNSMRIDEDGNLICSFRHLNAVLALDRTKGENQILWVLSGSGDEFGLTEDQKFSCQHYATMDGTYITLFDNGNRTKHTRIVSYQLDKENKALKSYKEYSLANKFSVACGSVQHLGDEVFVIGWGGATKDAECMTVYDFAKGEELLKVTLKNRRNITYRCVYYD